MNINEADASHLKLFHKLIAAMELDLRLPTGLLVELLDQSDWELVIKAAVIAEVALGEAIKRSLRSEDLDRVTERIEHGLGPKIKVAERYGFLDKVRLDHLKEIARMRNICVHDRSGLDFTFQTYLNDPANERSFKRRLGRLVAADDMATAPFTPEVFRGPSAAVMVRLTQVCALLLVGRPATGFH